MSLQPSFPHNPQRRERIVNLADFRRASTESPSTSASASASAFPSETPGDQNGGEIEADVAE